MDPLRDRHKDLGITNGKRLSRTHAEVRAECLQNFKNQHWRPASPGACQTRVKILVHTTSLACCRFICNKRDDVHHAASTSSQVFLQIPLYFALQGNGPMCEPTARPLTGRPLSSASWLASWTPTRRTGRSSDP